MANTHYSGPVNSENGFKLNKIGETEYYLDYDSGELVIGAGSVVGTNVGLRIDATGKVQIANLETDLVVESGLIKQEDNIGTVELTSNSTADAGANLKMFASSHPTTPFDIQLRSGATPVIQWDESAAAVILGAAASHQIQLDSSTLVINKEGDAIDSVLRLGANDRYLEVSGSNNGSDGSNARFYGSSHPSQAGDWELRDGSAAVVSYDKSTESIQIGKTSDPTVTELSLNADDIQIFAGAAQTGLVHMGNSDGVLQITGGSTSGNGPSLVMYGGSHASRALDFVLSNAASEILAWDNSASTLTSIAQSIFTTSAGPQVVLEDGGTFGTNADPHMTFRDGAGLGAVLGYNNAASNDMVLDQRRAAGSLNLQHNSTTRIAIDATGVGLYGVTPVAQASKINDPSGGATVDAEARTAINAILDALEGIGISASV